MSTCRVPNDAGSAFCFCSIYPPVGEFCRYRSVDETKKNTIKQVSRYFSPQRFQKQGMGAVRQNFVPIGMFVLHFSKAGGDGSIGCKYANEMCEELQQGKAPCCSAGSVSSIAGCQAHALEPKMHSLALNSSQHTPRALEKLPQLESSLER